MGQCFGLFPLNITSTQPHEVKFCWKSLKTMFSFVFIICCLLTTLFSLKSQLEVGPLSPVNIIRTIFYLVCAIICILFFRISQKWRSLNIRWSKIEINFLCKKYELPATRWTLKKRILVFLITSLILAFSEHLLSIIDSVNKIIFELQYCNATKYNILEIFVTRHFGFVTNNFPFSYNHLIGIMIEYFNVSYTFYWNFLDIFSIIISIGISDLFERLNHRLESLKSMHIDEMTW